MEDSESSLRTDGPPSPVNYEKSLMDRWTLYEAFCPSLQVVPPVFVGEIILLAVARKLTASREILLWMTPSEAPKALQASECSELLDPMRASCWISAQH